MVLGHYATALIPHQRVPTAPFWLFLLAANLLDFAWLAFALAGPEMPAPGSMFEATFHNIRVEMPYTHDGFAVGVWVLVGFGLGFAVTRQIAPALWCGALVIVHELCDLLSGFEHYLYDDVFPIGLNLYGRAPELALVFEAAFGGVCVWWYLRARAAQGKPVSVATGRWLYVVFIGGALSFLPIARTPMGHWLGMGG